MKQRQGTAEGILQLRFWACILLARHVWLGPSEKHLPRPAFGI